MFNQDRFLAQRYIDRTHDTPVPDLKQFFGPDEPPVWTVRQLSGMEVALAKESAKRTRNSLAALNVIKSRFASVDQATKNMAEILEAARDYKTVDFVERLEHLVLASVSPKCTIDMALKLSKVSPYTFFEITNQILFLTGHGMTLEG